MTGVVALGTFDLLHVGHLRFLQEARSFGDHLTVAVNTDKFVASYKRQPICPLDERIDMLDALKVVDRVIVNEGGADSRPALLEARAEIIAIGDDWGYDRYLLQLGVTQDWLDIHGIRIKFLPYTDGVSTTEIIRRCASRL